MTVKASSLRLWTALWIVYLVWGSTYLAIRVMVRTMPPLLSGGLRFVLAGAILAGVLAVRERSLRVRPRELGASALLGAMLLTGGVGVVTVAETDIASSLAAIIASSVPLQVIVLRSVGGDRPPLSTLASVAVGLVGVTVVVAPGGGSEATAIGLALMVFATVSWSVGSFVSARAPTPRDPFVATAYEMIFGGAFLLLLGVAFGELGDVEAGAVSGESLAAFTYLVVVGSLVAFSAYVWLLHHAPISKVVTHQYVNPIVAVALGALVLGEELTRTTILGALLIVGSVFAVVRRERDAPAPAAQRSRETDEPVDQAA
jgi:drug/metabolite transporter (DMT)-like permease